MKKPTLLFFLLFSFFTAKSQLQLIRGGITTTLVSTSGGTCTQDITLTANAKLKTLDDKAYIISGNITGDFDLTAELFANSKLTLSGAVTYTGSTVVTRGELILTNTSDFRSFNLNISAGAALTIDASAYGNLNSSAPYLVFGSNFTSDFTVTGAGQVNFKGIRDKYYGVYSSTNKSMVFNMASGGQLNIDSGDWLTGASGVGVFANNLGNLNLKTNSFLYIDGTTAQFDKVTGAGTIFYSGNNDMTIKIGVSNGTCDWNGIFLNYSSGKLNIEKVGTGTITCASYNRNFNNNTEKISVTVSAGSLSIGNGRDDRTYPEIGNIINNTTLIVNLSRESSQHQSLYLRNAISGIGNFVKKGDRSVGLAGPPLSGIVEYTGTTTVESGELVLVCKELKNSAIIVQNGSTLTTRTADTAFGSVISHNDGVITSSGGLFMAASSAMHFEFTQDVNSYTKLIVPDITAPNGFLMKLSGVGVAADTLSRNITLIQCTGSLPTILPTIVENSIDYGSGSRKCVALRWVRGTGLVATFAATGPVISSLSLSNICIGSTKSYTITTGGAPAETAWRAVNPEIVSISANGVATGLFNGRTAVTYTNTDGCLVSSIINVNGHVIRPEHTKDTLCVGNKIILKAYDTPRGGSNSNANPVWTSENPLIATVGDKNGISTNRPVGYVTLLSLGSTTIKFKDNNNCTAEYTISNVKGLPIITPPTLAICQGGTLSLTGSGTAASTNPWSSANTNIATVAPSGLATGVAAGDAIITYTDNNGCKGTKLLNVRASTVIASAGEDKEICIGNSVAIGSPVQTGVTYSWSPNTGLSASDVANPTVNPTATTTYTLTAHSAASECPIIDRIDIQVNPLPGITSAQGTFSEIRPASTINLSASTDGTAGSWASSDATIVTIAAEINVKKATTTGVALGNANITYTDVKGCIGTHAVTVSNKADQTITFTPITDKTLGDADFTLSATTTSNLPITFITTSDKVIITGNSVKIVKAGKAIILAGQTGNDTYIPAAQISNTFCIKPERPAISINNRILTSSAGNDNQWYLNGYPIARGITKTYTAALDGNYTLKVTVEGCESVFSEPVSVSSSGKTAQTITFDPITPKTVGEADFTLSATVPSNLPITFSTTSDKVTITGNSVKIVKVGKAVVLASQGGNNTFNPATQISNTFYINPVKPGITYTESNKTMTSSADNGNQWYLNGNAIDGATGKTHTATANGSYTLKITIEECESVFSEPESISTIAKTSQTITFPIADKTFGDPVFALSATTTSNLPITFSTTSDKVTITGDSVKIVKAGKASILASQTGNDNVNPAQLSNTFCINPEKPVISISDKTLTSAANDGNQWYLNGNAIEGATGKNHTATLDGNYTLKVTIEECVSAFSESITVMVTGDISGDELRIFPNPVHDQLLIEWPAHENGLISLFSIAGQNLYSTSAAGKAIISMKDFPSGIYILKIQTAGKMVVRKVVKN